MAKPLRAYRESRGLSREQLADILTQRLGRPITAGGVQRFENYDNLPASWLKALDLKAQPQRGPQGFVEAEPWDSATSGPEPAGDAFGSEGRDSSAGGGTSSPPPPPPVIYPHARERLAGLHVGMGAVLTAASRNEGYSVVFGAYAPSLAQSWVEAAQAGDGTAKRVVEAMETGGAMAGLVVGYGMLALACVYVSGRAPQLGSFFGGWQGFHDAARERSAAGAAVNGAGGRDPWGAGGWVAESGSAPEEDVDAGGARDDHRSNGLGEDAPGA